MPLRYALVAGSIAFVTAMLSFSGSASADEPALAPAPVLGEPPPAPPPPEHKPDKVAPTPDAPDVVSSGSPPVEAALAPPAATGGAGAPQIERAQGEPTQHRDPGTEGPRLALGAGGHVTFGAGPAVSVGVRMLAEVGNTRWSIGVEGRYDAPASGQTTQGANARASLLGASVVPCVRAQGLWACGVLLLSRVEAEASDLTTPTVRERSFFLGIGGRLQMHFALPLGFALRLGTELLAHPLPYELKSGTHRLFKSFALSTTLGPSLVRAF